MGEKSRRERSNEVGEQRALALKMYEKGNAKLLQSRFARERERERDSDGSTHEGILKPYPCVRSLVLFSRIYRDNAVALDTC